MKYLLLASQSKSRQKLLKESLIKFKLIEQNLNEARCDWGLPLQKLVQSIAQQKMNHVILPRSSKKQDSCFVLTADTLGRDCNGDIHGKPINKADAIKKIKLFRLGAITGTAICLEKKAWKSGFWATQKRIIRYAQAKYVFDVPDHLIEWYLKSFKNEGYLSVSGGVQIEGIGAQFLRVLTGSYTAVLGLPLYELRKSLEDLGFGY